MPSSLAGGPCSSLFNAMGGIGAWGWAVSIRYALVQHSRGNAGEGRWLVGRIGAPGGVAVNHGRRGAVRGRPRVSTQMQSCMNAMLAEPTQAVGTCNCLGDIGSRIMGPRKDSERWSPMENREYNPGNKMKSMDIGKIGGGD